MKVPKVETVTLEAFHLSSGGGLVVVVVGEVVASNVALICSDHKPQPSPVLKPDESVCRLRYHALCSFVRVRSHRQRRTEASPWHQQLWTPSALCQTVKSCNQEHNTWYLC